MKDCTHGWGWLKTLTIGSALALSCLTGCNSATKQPLDNTIDDRAQSELAPLTVELTEEDGFSPEEIASRNEYEADKTVLREKIAAGKFTLEELYNSSDESPSTLSDSRRQEILQEISAENTSTDLDWLLEIPEYEAVDIVRALEYIKFLQENPEAAQQDAEGMDVETLERKKALIEKMTGVDFPYYDEFINQQSSSLEEQNALLAYANQSRVS